MTDHLSDDFFEALGAPKLESPFDLLDAYRFDLCYGHVGEGNLLDVGAYLGDFLRLVKADDRQYFGTEINQTRVNLVNSILGSDQVRLDFRNGHLDQFETDSLDNVVCMETLEHIIDDHFALSELCRVARHRVVITVPYREKIQPVLCMHCNQFTPHFGHQHAYDQGSFTKMVPTGWKVTKEYSFAKRVTRMVCQVLPDSKGFIPIMKLVDKLLPGDGRWLLVVLESQEQ